MHCWHGILRHFTLALIRRDADAQGQREKTGTQGERYLSTLRGLTYCQPSHSLNLSIMRMNYKGKKVNTRQILVANFENVAADFGIRFAITGGFLCMC